METSVLYIESKVVHVKLGKWRRDKAVVKRKYRCVWAKFERAQNRDGGRRDRK